MLHVHNRSFDSRTESGDYYRAILNDFHGAVAKLFGIGAGAAVCTSSSMPCL